LPFYKNLELPGKFFVFEGGEGCGKSTQAKLLAEHYQQANYPVILTKEPGGDEFYCKRIRQVILSKFNDSTLNPLVELLLFLADRAQHIQYTILPALQAGQIVVCDRYQASTYAYQVYARKICTPEKFLNLSTIATDGLQPDLSFWLDLDPALGFKRKQPDEPLDRMEQEGLPFHQKVREGFADYFMRYGPITTIIDGRLTPEEIQKFIQQTLKQQRLLT